MTDSDIDNDFAGLPMTAFPGTEKYIGTPARCKFVSCSLVTTFTEIRQSSNRGRSVGSVSAETLAVA